MFGLRVTPMRIALAIGLTLAVLRFVGFAPLALLDTRAIDLRLRWRGPEPASSDVVIVAVDDRSIEDVGRWPWSRSTMARLFDRLREAGPVVIGVDIVQSEATATPDLAALQGRVAQDALRAVQEALTETGGEDRALVDAVARTDNVVLGYFLRFDEGKAAPTPPAHPVGDEDLGEYGLVQSSGDGSGQRLIPVATSVVANLPALTAAARATGYFNTIPDPGDGYFRRVPMAIRYGDRMVVPLSLAMLSVAEPERALRVRLAPFGVEEVRYGDVSIPVAEDGQMLLNYRGPGRTFRHVSAVDLLEGRQDPQELRGKLVLVGVTATAVGDIRATPFDGIFPGVEQHATAIDNVLRRDFLRQPRWTVLLEIAVILAVAVALAVSLARLRGVRAALAAVVLVAAYLGGSQWLFLAAGIPLGIVYPVTGAGIVYAAIALHHYVAEEREKRRTREAFSRYLNPELARRVSENPELLRLGGERRCLTVLFSDLRGFTSMSEGLAPEELVEILNDYLGHMTQRIFARDGMLDKYIGDAIMAVWGAPIPRDDHAALACRAALDMRDRLADLKSGWREQGRPPLEAGIGINTGDMVVGNMGSTEHLSYTVIGDNVNLASRLEGLTKNYGVSIIVSDETLAAAGPGFVARELDLVAVKGKSLPVRIHELLACQDESAEWKPLLDAFAAALGAYRGRRFDDARAAFERILAERPDDAPSRLYLRRCDAFLAEPPPPAWAGVTVMDTK